MLTENTGPHSEKLETLKISLTNLRSSTNFQENQLDKRNYYRSVYLERARFEQETKRVIHRIRDIKY